MKTKYKLLASTDSQPSQVTKSKNKDLDFWFGFGVLKYYKVAETIVQTITVIA